MRLKTVGTFDKPLYVTAPPGDARRVFVVEREGRVRVVRDGVPRPGSFLDVSGEVSTSGDGGLLSIAFPPDYETSGRVLLFFVADADTVRVAELHRDPADPERTVGPLRTVLDVVQPGVVNHHGGQLLFDPIGLLYVFTGDRSPPGDAAGLAQNLDLLVGKILRIDPQPSGGQPYSVPPDNPFVGQADRRPEIWSYGLRNPYRGSFDRLTGALTIADVGQSRFEEVNHLSSLAAARGVNFGWSLCEASRRHPFDGSGCPLTGTAGYVAPIHEYPNLHAPCTSLTGGYVVRDPALEELAGRYVYGDYCTGEVRRVNVPSGGGDAPVLRMPELNLASFGEDALGRIYTTELVTGRVSRLTDDPVASEAPSQAGTAADRRAPRLRLRLRTGRRQRPLRNRGVIVRVRCDEPCRYRAGARISVGAAQGKVRARGRIGSVSAGGAVRLRLRLGPRGAASVRRALTRGRIVRARVEVRARDGTGNLARAGRLIRLTR